jgi:outer membrane biosynthesis protein TonB
MAGAIEAKGGASGGDGGQVEASGHALAFEGTVDTTAAQGRTGSLLLDPTNIYIAASTVSASGGGMTGADSSANSSGPSTFQATGTATDSYLSTSTLQTALGSNSVTVQTTSAAAGVGNINVIDPISWSSGSSLSLVADASITVKGSITSTAGVVGMRAMGTGATITQTAAITAPSLVAYADQGSVTLSSSNSVTNVAGYAGSGGFTFNNSGAVSVNTVSTPPVGASNGIRTNGGNVLITAGGTIDIVQGTTYGISAGTGNVTLVSLGGSINAIGSAVLSGGGLTASASGGLNLIGSSVAVSSASLTASGGALQLNNSNAGGLTLNGITGSNSVSIAQSAGNVTVAGTVQAGTGSILGVRTPGTLLQGGGLLKGDTIVLQDSVPGGQIGTSASPLATSSPSGTASLNVAASSNAVYLTHTGGLSVNQMALNPGAPVSVMASGDLTINAPIAASTVSPLLLASSGSNTKLTLTANAVVSGANVNLQADKMDLQAGSSVTSAAGTLISLSPRTAGAAVDLGSSTDAASNTLELSAAEIGRLSTSSFLILGSTTSGTMNVTQAFTPASSATLFLKSGGAINQAGTAPITTPNLVVNALGDVALDASNSVTNVAASLGDASNQGRNFRIKNLGALNVASLNGYNGISTQFSAGYDSTAPAGVIALISGGALTQSPGTLLGGAAVYAEGKSVVLTEANSTGVIAGKATGTASGDVFKYKSSNGINLNTVNSFSGVSHASAADNLAIELTGTSISQSAGANVITNKGLNVATTGSVFLTSTGNSINALSAAGVSQLQYSQSGGLAVGVNGVGVSATGGGVSITSNSDALTVTTPISASNGVQLMALGGALGDLTLASASINSGTGTLLLKGTNVVALSNATLTSPSGTSIVAGNSAYVGVGTTTVGGGAIGVTNTSSTPIPLTIGNLSTLSVASGASIAKVDLTGGTITGNGVLTITGGMGWSGGSMTGTGTTSLASGAAMAITGTSHTLSRPVTNSGTINLNGGSLTFASGGSIANLAAAGVVNIAGDFNFDGSGGTFNNNGSFNKTAGTGTASIGGMSFTNSSTGTIVSGSGTLAFGSGVFSTNSGTLGVTGGATLSTTNTTLINSGGMITGSGTLDLGTGQLLNHGTISPGGTGSIATLNFVTPSLTLGSGSVLATDLTSTSSYDVVNVTGNVSVSSLTVNVNNVSASYVSGDVFTPLRSTAGGTVTGTAPTVTGFTTSLTAGPPAALQMVYGSPAPGPSPSPSPSPSPTTSPTPSPSPAPSPTPASPAPSPAPTPAPAPSPSPTPAPSPSPAPAPAPAPTPAPAPSPATAPAPSPTASATALRLQEILPDVSSNIVEQVVTEQKNTLTTFVSLLLKEEKAQADVKEKELDAKAGSDKSKNNKDPIVTDTQCKP